jgi:hypothetical protein
MLDAMMAIEHIANINGIYGILEGIMALFSALLFFAALFVAFAAIGSSVLRSMPRIDAVIASRGLPARRIIRFGTPRSGCRLA